uniref:(northern house mosquito) hypothetical protein n=1 Tax=Culex pipiens TaxID=7175 RepID=A0A8D8CCC1_CULPI
MPRYLYSARRKHPHQLRVLLLDLLNDLLHRCHELHHHGLNRRKLLGRENILLLEMLLAWVSILLLLEPPSVLTVFRHRCNFPLDTRVPGCEVIGTFKPIRGKSRILVATFGSHPRRHFWIPIRGGGGTCPDCWDTQFAHGKQRNKTIV